MLTRLGVKVVAASVDGEAAARKIASDLNLDFPVGFGVTASDIKTLGAYTEDRKGETIMEPTEFILRPNGEVAASLYGTTQLGRMNPHEVAVFVKDRL